MLVDEACALHQTALHEHSEGPFAVEPIVETLYQGTLEVQPQALFRVPRRSAGRAVIEHMTTHYWLIKSEPYKYSWAQLQKDGRTQWDGVRNFEARNNLRAMRQGDLLLYYHSNEGKEIVGVARVKTTAYPDTTDDGDWSAIDVEPVCPLQTPVGLHQIKEEPRLHQMALLRRSRVSVVPVTKAEFQRILSLGKVKLNEVQARPTRGAA